MPPLSAEAQAPEQAVEEGVPVAVGAVPVQAAVASAAGVREAALVVAGAVERVLLVKQAMPGSKWVG
jgi:hypothetical protein